MAKAIRKVTIRLPLGLLEKAQDCTGEGITETVRQGLQLVAASRAYESLFKLRGKVRFSKSAKKLREDRT